MPMKTVKARLVPLAVLLFVFGPVPVANAQSAADCHAYAQRAKSSTSRISGSARGAAGGALFGAIAGNAGKGAAIGALIGAVGSSAQRQNNYNTVYDDCMRSRQYQ